MAPDNDQPKLLLVDDERDLLVLLRKVLAKNCDCKVSLAASGAAAFDLVKNWQPDVVLTDILMSDTDGMELLEKVRRFDPQISVIMMTGYGTVDLAVKALKNGAYDFFEKPFDNADIIRVVRRAIEYTRLLRENQQLQQRLLATDDKSEIIGNSSPLRQTVDLLARLAASDATVLIRGESGTGKELAARTLHRLSKRSENKMITVNCPALPEQILESELFGYCKGAFTGADSDKDGLFYEAAGSTILLDEIADIPVSVQTKLLRVLQEKEIQPLGQTKTVKVDVRVLASTNQNLEEKMARGEFREDLYYRLNVMTVTMPCLKEIRDDIPLMAHHFLEKYATEYKRKGLEFSVEALQCLMRRKWKGNVRELQNLINRAVLLAATPVLGPGDFLDFEKDDDESVSTATEIPTCFHKLPYKEAKKEIVDRFTVSYLSNNLIRHNGNVSAAARASKMERQAFQRLMRRYNLQSATFKEKNPADI